MAHLMDRVGPVRYINILPWLSRQNCNFLKFLWSLSSLQRRKYTTKQHQIEEFRQLSASLLSVELMYQRKFLFSSQGKRIVGAICSTDFAQQYLLTTATNPANGHLFYYCNCYGHYDYGARSVKCTIHYWECPLTT